MSSSSPPSTGSPPTAVRAGGSEPPGTAATAVLPGVRHLSLALPAVLAVAAWAVLAEASGLLRQLQRPGAPAYPIEALGGGVSPHGALDRAENAMRAWVGIDERAAEVFVAVYSVVDLLFVLAYTVLLTVFLRRCFRSAERHAWNSPLEPWYRDPLWPKPRPAETGWVIRWLRPLALLVAADVVEDLSRWGVFALGQDGSVPGSLVLTAWFAEKVKLLAAALVAITVLTALHDLLTEPKQDGGAWEQFRVRPTAFAGLVRARRAVATLRGHVALVVVFASLLLFDVTGQVGDVLRRWVDAPYAWSALTFLLGLASVALLSLTMWTSCRRVILADATRVRMPSAPQRWTWRWWAVVLAAGAVAAVLAGVAGWQRLWGLTLVVAGLGVLQLLSLGVDRRWLTVTGEVAERETRRARTGMPADGEAEHRTAVAQRGTYQRTARWLAVVPLAALGIAMVRAAFGPLTLSFLRSSEYSPGSATTLLLIGLALLVLLSTVVLRALRERDRCVEEVDPLEGLHKAALVAVLIPVVAALALPLHVPPVLGSVAVVALAVAGVSLVFAELERFSEVCAPPSGLAILAFRRVPVFLMLAVWVVAGSAFTGDRPHEVRTTGTAPEPIALRTLFSQWAEANCLATPGEPVPLVLAAAEGGGIRAAYWSASVLTDLLPQQVVEGCPQASPRSRLFAVSGISGGSVGAVAHLSEPTRTGHWYEDALGEPDATSTALATGLLVDLPRVLVGFPADDRAAWLERAWEKALPELEENHFERLRPGATEEGPDGPVGDGWMPLTLLGGAQVETGCRVSTSAVHLAAGPSSDCRRLRGRDNTVDLGGGLQAPAAPTTVDTLGGLACRGSLRASSAALLSARFPYISPSGQLPCPVGGRTVSVVDGGYADGSGAAGVGDLWAQLEPLVAAHNAASSSSKGRKVVPVYVRIDNHYAATAEGVGPRRAMELLVPPLTKLRATATADVDRKQRTVAQLTAGVPGLPQQTCDVPGQPDSGEFVLSPTTRPGLPAPLAWTLARPSRDDLDDQREDLFREKGDARPGRDARALLTGQARITCTEGGTARPVG